jgi:NADPH-dependent curcumin reductase CurA
MDFFEIRDMTPPRLEEGEILIRVLFIGIDPVMRVWLSGAKTYIDSVQVGSVMPAFGVG